MKIDDILRNVVRQTQNEQEDGGVIVATISNKETVADIKEEICKALLEELAKEDYSFDAFAESKVEQIVRVFFDQERYGSYE